VCVACERTPKANRQPRWNGGDGERALDEEVWFKEAYQRATIAAQSVETLERLTRQSNPGRCPDQEASSGGAKCKPASLRGYRLFFRTSNFYNRAKTLQ
jgi:hypothetical protein